jgi:hypothetical protein
MSTKPPPSHPSAEVPQAAARGTFRDALGGLSNLRQLLQSIRVGPKALGAVLPDVLASCAPLRASLDELLDAIAAELPESKATDSLREFAAPRIVELERALGVAIRSILNARNRLQLEDVVDRVSRELDAVRELVDMLEDAIEGPTVRLSLLEIVRQTAGGPERAGREGIKATLSSTPEGLELLVNARVAMALVASGANLVLGPAGAPPHVLIGRLPNGGCGLSVSRDPAAGEALTLPRRWLIEPTLPCLEVAARLAGARLERADGDASFSVVWPPEAYGSRHPNGV